MEFGEIAPAPISDFARVSLMVGTMLSLILFEFLFPLRATVEPKFRRIVRNLSLAVTSAVVVRAIFLSALIFCANSVETSQIGILNLMQLPWIAESFLAVVFLDSTLYYWHRLNHRARFFWRFHSAHHVDLDLDVSTAVRFHFGELSLSVIFRLAQIFVFGISPFNLVLFETCVVLFAQFHHANIRLPKKLDDFLAKVFVTPRMHGIHHSMVRVETDSNYSTIFSLWDRVHGTQTIKTPQEQVLIGVPAYSDPSEQSFLKVLLMPFKKPRPWGTDRRRLPY